MTVASRVTDLATAVGNYLRDSVLPRLLPAGGTAGQVLAKTSGADYAAAWQAPGGGSSAVATLNVPTYTAYAEVVVASAGVTASSRVFAALVGELDAENDAEELSDLAMEVFAVPEAGQIRFVLTASSGFSGDFKVNYQIT